MIGTCIGAYSYITFQDQIWGTLLHQNDGSNASKGTFRESSHVDIQGKNEVRQFQMAAANTIK